MALSMSLPTTRAVVAPGNRTLQRVAASKENVLAVWADLRPHDAIELEHGTATGEHSLRALMRMVSEDPSARCWLLDGKPFALAGLNETKDGAHPWMLATPLLARVGKRATSMGKVRVQTWRALMVRAGRPVWNIVHAESPNVRWLERIGFTLGPSFMRDCPNGERALYRPFWIE